MLEAILVVILLPVAVISAVFTAALGIGIITAIKNSSKGSDKN